MIKNFVSYIHKHPYMVFFLAIKEIIDLIKDIYDYSNKLNTLSIMQFNHFDLLDFVILLIILSILYFLLRRNKELENQMAEKDKIFQDQLIDISFRIVYLQGFIKNSNIFDDIEHKDIIIDKLNNENVAYLFEMNKYQLEEQRKQEENNIELKNQGKEITGRQEITKIRKRTLRSPLIMSMPDFEKIKKEFLNKYKMQ